MLRKANFSKSRNEALLRHQIYPEINLTHLKIWCYFWENILSRKWSCLETQFYSTSRKTRNQSPNKIIATKHLYMHKKIIFAKLLCAKYCSKCLIQIQQVQMLRSLYSLREIKKLQNKLTSEWQMLWIRGVTMLMCYPWTSIGWICGVSFITW